MFIKIEMNGLIPNVEFAIASYLSIIGQVNYDLKFQDYGKNPLSFQPNALLAAFNLERKAEVLLINQVGKID